MELLLTMIAVTFGKCAKASYCWRFPFTRTDRSDYNHRTHHLPRWGCKSRPSFKVVLFVRPFRVQDDGCLSDVICTAEGPCSQNENRSKLEPNVHLLTTCVRCNHYSLGIDSTIEITVRQDLLTCYHKRYVQRSIC